MPFTPRDLLYRTYEKRLESVVRHGPKPEHVGVILAGNRRWARAMGYADEGLDLGEAAKRITPDEIARYLYTAGLPDPDLIIRTSGEVRLSGFLLWQSAHSEFYFCDPYWPDFRRIDFLRAVREYQQRHRRFGR